MNDHKPAATEPSRPAATTDAPADCGIPRECERVVPGWVVFSDNAPTAAMFALGTILMWRIGWVFGTAYLAYCLLAVVAFWGRICPVCHHFGTRACPCGYGVVSPLLFRRRTGREFRRVFRTNIVIMFPCFFVPPVAGAVLVWQGSARSVVVVLVAFCVMAFVAIPLISKLVGCRGCAIKDQCPWMT